jgi:hypothetical protein
MKVLQVNLKFNVTKPQLEAAWLAAAPQFANLPGLIWKVWLMNEAEHVAGGIYLFDREASAQAYLTGPIVAGLKENPAIGAIDAKLFDVMEAHSLITRGLTNEMVS